MTQEALQSTPPEANPVVSARQEFNQSLLNPSYEGNQLILRLVKLQNTLYQSDLLPDEIFHELTIVSGQALERARMQNDAASLNTLEGLYSSYTITRSNFERRGAKTNPRPTESQTRSETPISPQPTRTEDLPQMTAAKGATRQPIQTQTSALETSSTQQNPPRELPNSLKQIKEIFDQSEGPVAIADLVEELQKPEGTVRNYISQLRVHGVNIESIKENNRVNSYQLARPEAPKAEAEKTDNSQ